MAASQQRQRRLGRRTPCHFPLYLKPAVSVPLDVFAFVTTTSTSPAACAGVVQKIFVELFTTTFVAATPPNVTVAPLSKFVPRIVTEVPPEVEPLVALIDVTVTTFTTLTLADFVSEQPALVVTVTDSVSVPSEPAVNVIAFVPLPAVIVPFVIDQL
jgi:hypothetical protein